MNLDMAECAVAFPPYVEGLRGYAQLFALSTQRRLLFYFGESAGKE